MVVAVAVAVVVAVAVTEGTRLSVTQQLPFPEQVVEGYAAAEEWEGR